MKKVCYIAVLGAALLFSCLKKGQPVTIVRDCTGSYLRMDGKDYHICNTEKTDAFVTGAEVNARFLKIGSCKGEANDMPVCEMLHENEGWIKVKRIY